MNCNAVLHFVEDGNLEGVKRILSMLEENEVCEYLNGSSTSTPLIAAARYGHVEIVEYLLSLNADPSACGTVCFDGEVIPKVPPLWAAAAAGHLEVCKILIDRKVDVNQTSSTNSTPLRGACYDGHLEIVKYLVECGADIEIPNRHGHTALMISCYRGKEELVEYLLDKGADVNRRSLKGNTALHDAAEIGHTKIICMLLNAGAKMLPDDYGVTPLLIAAMHGQRDTVILMSAYSAKVDQRNAWKLMGATMVDRKNDLGLGVACWRTAYSAFLPSPPDLEDDGMLPEEDVLPPLNDVQLRVYGGYREICSLREVEELVGDPEAIRMQALLIRERILGDSHPETHYYLRLRGAIFCDFGRWDRCFEFWTYILQLEQHYMPPLSIPTSSAFVAFADTFNALIDSMILQNERPSLNAPENKITLEQIIIIMERALYEAEKYIRLDEEPELDLFDGYDTRQETENLLHVILYYVHLANRAHFLTVTYDSELSARVNSFLSHRNGANRANQRNGGNSSQQLHPLVSSTSVTASSSSSSQGLSSRSRSIASSPNGLPMDTFNMLFTLSTSPTVSTSQSLSLPSTSSMPPPQSSPEQSACLLSPVRNHHRPQNHPRYVESHADESPNAFFSSATSPSLCSRAYLAPLTDDMELEPKTVLPLKPKCPNLRCLMRRVCAIFELLKVSPLHMACNEQERCEIRRTPSHFVIEKLLEAGVNVLEVDDFDNTALHILLNNSSCSPTLVKMLLDAGIPLMARNIFNETCLDLIVKKSPSFIGRLHIGRYLTLKQFAANAVMRNLSGTTTFQGILPRELEEYLTIF